MDTYLGLSSAFLFLPWRHSQREDKMICGVVILWARVIIPAKDRHRKHVLLIIIANYRLLLSFNSQPSILSYPAASWMAFPYCSINNSLLLEFLSPFQVLTTNPYPHSAPKLPLPYTYVRLTSRVDLLGYLCFFCLVGCQIKKRHSTYTINVF